MNSFIKQAAVLLCILFASGLSAQTIERRVINTTGGLLAPSGGPQLHHNVGETFSTPLSGGGYMLTQGFIQPIVASIPPITGSLSVCAGSSTTLGNTATGGTWSSSNTTVATVGSTGIVSGLVAGTSTISYTVGGSSVTAIVTVNPLPNAGTISGTASVCPGGATTFSTSSTMTGSWSSTNTAVGTVASLTGAFTGISVGTTTISYTVTNGCGTVAATIIATVHPLPNAGTITGVSTVIVGGNTTLSNTITGGSWSSSSTSIATVGTTGVVSGVAAGTVTISYTITNFCGNAVATYNVTVFNAVDAGALSFDGVNDRVSIGTPIPSGSSYTKEAWVYTKTSSGFQNIISSLNAPLYINFGILRAGQGGSFDLVSDGTTMPIDTWVHVAVTYDATSNTMKLYKNGVLISTATSVPSYTTEATFLGFHSGLISNLYGAMDEVRIWNRALCVDEIVNNMNCETGLPQTGLRAYYRFNQGVVAGDNTAINTLTDLSGNSFTGTLDNFTLTGTSSNWIAGHITGACSSFSPVTAGTITGTATVCVGATTNLSSSGTSGGVWSSTNTAVGTVNDSTGVVTGIAMGTTTISYTVTSSCGSVAATMVVSVNSTPSSGVMNGATTACVGATTTYSMTPSTRLFVLNPSAIAGEKPVGNAAFGGTYTITNQSAKYAPLSDTLACSALTTGYFSGKVAIVRRGTCSYVFKAQIAQDAGALAVIIVDNTTSTIPVSPGGTAPTVTIPVYGVTKADGLALINQLNLGQDVRVTVGIDSVWTGVWSSNNTSVATVGSTGVVAGVGAGTASIQYAVTSDCGSTVATKTITVNALPNVGTISGTATLCVAGTTTLTTTGSGGVWSSTNTAVGTVNPSTGLVTGISVGTAMISYTATNSCGSAAATQVVTVSTTPSAGAISGAATVCVGATTNLSSSGISGGVWSSINTAVGTVNASTGVVTGIAMGTTTISYTVTNSCGTVAATIIATVNPLPVAGTISGTSSICVGATTNLSASGTSGGVWSSTNTAAGTVNASTGVVTGVAMGTTTISYTVSNECGSVSATQTIAVNPLPNAGTITGASSVNPGASITLSNTTSGGSWSSSDPAIATIGSTGIVSGVSPGTTTISYTVTNGCGSVSATKTVTVNAVLETGITGTLTVCVGSNTTLSNSTSGGSWSSSNTLKAVVNTEGVVTGLNAGTTIISYTLSGISVTAIVTVNALPLAGTLSGATSVCAGSTATVSKTGTGGEWSSSETSIATVGTTGIVSGLTEGTTTISYTVSNGCGSVAVTRVVTVIATPNAGTISGASSICRTTTTTLTSSVSGGTWSSNYPAGASVNSSTGLVTGVAAGSFVISYRITNSCGTAYAMFPISIINAPVLGVMSGATTVCEAATTTLTNTTAGGTWSSTNTGAATINAATGAATGVAAGTTTISYNVTNICGSATVSRALTVNPLPVAAVISGTTTLSAGTTTTLTATPSGGTWLSASGTIASINASTGVTTGVAVGVATVSFTKTNSCGSVVTTVSVTVTGAITPITGTRVVCQGATTNLANATAGGTWSTADGAIATIGTTGVVTGVGAGTTTVTYTFSGGGNVTATVTVNASPAAYTGSGILCSGSQLNLGSIIPGCTWTSGTAARATVGLTTGIVTGGNTFGTVNISYTSGGCRTITQLTVTAAVGPTTGISSPCLGSTFTALNSTPGGTWSSSNTARATIDASSGLLTAVGGGTVTISYTISAGCVRTTTVTVGTPPAITGNPSLCLGQNSLLVSSGGTWSSSNPVIASVAASGVVTGVTLGNAVITYRSTANALCFVTQAVTVNPLPSAIVAPGALCPGQTATLTSTPSGGTWTSNFPTKASVDPSTGVVTAVIYNFSTISIVNITYTLPTGCGGMAAVTVNPLPSPIGGGSRNICVAGSTTLTNSTSGGTWSSSSPAIATTAGGVVSGVSAGLATISYSNALGCANTTEVTVNAMPGANTGTATLCLPGGTTTLSNPAGAGTWSSSNTTKATVNFSSGLVTGINTGTANITYTKAAGCTSVTQVTVSMCSARPGMTEDDGSSNIFSVSPNPTTGAINLTTDVAGKVVIYTIDGKELQQYDAKAGTTNMSLPAGIASGVYMLRFNGVDGSSKMVRLVYQQ